MKRKSLTSIMLLVGATYSLYQSRLVRRSPPPANQLMGVADTVFNNLTEAECRVCHPNTVDSHHILYDQDIPQGACSVNSNDCIKTTYCDPDLCSDSGDACSVDGDCPLVGQGESCGEVCRWPVSCLQTPNTDGYVPYSIYTCLSCHPQTIQRRCYRVYRIQMIVWSVTSDSRSGLCPSLDSSSTVRRTVSPVTAISWITSAWTHNSVLCPVTGNTCPQADGDRRTP